MPAALSPCCRDSKRASVTLASPPFAALKEKDADGAAASVSAVSDAVNGAAALASSELPGDALLLDQLMANLQTQPQLSSSASSNSASPTSAQAAAIIAGQGVDTSFFAAAPAPSAASVSASASASSSPSQQRSRPPPLPANIPPVRSPALYKSSSSSGVVSPSTSPLPASAASCPPPPPASEARSVSASFSPPPPPPAPPVADGPPAWSAGQSTPLSFEQYAEQHRLDPDAYQIYTQRWQTAQQAHSQPNGKLSPPAALMLNSSHPPPVSLPVTTGAASASSSRKSSIDATPPPPPPFSSPPAAAPPPPPPPPAAAPEPLSDFARELGRGSLVDVWSRRARSWQCGEVVEVTNSSSGSMVNVIDYSTHTREWMRRASSRLAAPFTKSVEQGASPPPSPKQQQAAASRKQSAAAEQQSAAGIGMQKVTAALSSLSSAAAALLPSAVTSPKASSANGDRGFSSPAAASPRAALPKTATVPNPPPSQSPSPSSAAASVAAPSTAAALAASPVAAAGAAAPSNSQSASPAAAAGPGWSRSLTVGSVLDAYDTEQVWRVAEVVRDAGSELFIHYRGWASKWDEFVPRDSRRLAPLRTYSVGDTGPRKQPQLQQPPPEQQLPVAYPVNAYAAPAASSSSRSSSRYDCRSDCKWKRVLSMGLGHREMQSLDSLFAVCCQLQDEYADHLLSGSQSQQSFSSFRHKLSRLSAEIDKQRGQLPASAAFFLQQAAAIARTIESGVVEQEETLRRQLLAEQEETFMRRLNRHFLLSTVPADGDCLFAAIGKGFAKRVELMQAAQREEEERAREREREQPQPAPLALPPPAADDAVSASTVIKQEEVRGLYSPALLALPAPAEPAAGLPLPSQVPAVYRAKAVQTLLSTPAFHPLIRREVREALVQEREGRGDSTSKSIVAELTQRCGSTQAELEAAVDSPSALEVYASVMGRSGIYGTQLEVEALSAALHVPIHAYYRAGQEDDAEQEGRAAAAAEELRPTQVIGEGEKPPAIALAFYLGNRHYNLLLPRPPPPPPQPQPVLPQPAPITASTSAAKPPLHPSAAADHRLDAADDELMIALMENSTPSPLPAQLSAASAADSQQSLRRSASGGSLTSSQPAGEPVAAGGAGLHRRERSKDELHLLTQSSASSPRVRTMISKWEGGAPVPLLPSAVKAAMSLSTQQPPQEHPAAQRRGSAVAAPSPLAPAPAAQRSASLPFSSPASSSPLTAPDMQLLILVQGQADPRPVTIACDVSSPLRAARLSQSSLLQSSLGSGISLSSTRTSARSWLDWKMERFILLQPIEAEHSDQEPQQQLQLQQAGSAQS